MCATSWENVVSGPTETEKDRGTHTVSLTKLSPELGGFHWHTLKSRRSL